MTKLSAMWKSGWRTLQGEASVGCDDGIMLVPIAGWREWTQDWTEAEDLGKKGGKEIETYFLSLAIIPLSLSELGFPEKAVIMELIVQEFS